MPRDNSKKYRKSSPRYAPLSLLLLQQQIRNLSLNEQVSCVSKWGASLLIYIRLARVKCLFTGRADFSHWVVITTLITFWGLFNICWGWLLILPIIVNIWPICKWGFGPITIANKINPQWGLIRWIIYQIIIRILFSVTLFQQR